MAGVSNNYPTLEQFAANVAAVIGKIEVIEQELYDRIVYPHAGLNQFSFFTTPKGAGFSSESGNGGNTKTDADTNMTQNGQLPAPQAFWIDGIQVDFDAGSTVAGTTDYTNVNPSIVAAAQAAPDSLTDKAAILNSGWVQMFIGQKPYYQMGPLKYFPPRAQTRIDSSQCNGAVAANAMVTSAVYSGGECRKIDPGLGLATGFNFGVNINFPVLVPTVTNNGRLKVTLDGWLFRAAQ